MSDGRPQRRNRSPRRMLVQGFLSLMTWSGCILYLGLNFPPIVPGVCLLVTICSVVMSGSVVYWLE